MKSLKNRNIRNLLWVFDNHFGFAKMGNILYSNWFNPFATLWINIRSFPIRQALFLPIIVYGRPKLFNLSGNMKIDGKISFGMIKFNKTQPNSPSNMGVQSELVNQGTILFHGDGIIGTGNKIRVAPRALLDIGSSFKITDFVNIGCYKRITIGEQSWIVHRCQLFDANYHYVANFSKRIIPKWMKSITIGKGCWVCNSSTVTGGTILPDFTIVASHSLVNKDYSQLKPNSMIGGVPAKLLATGFRRVDNRECERTINRFYEKYPDEVFQIPQEMTMQMVSDYIE